MYVTVSSALELIDEGERLPLSSEVIEPGVEPGEMEPEGVEKFPLAIKDELAPDCENADEVNGSDALPDSAAELGETDPEGIEKFPLGCRDVGAERDPVGDADGGYWITIVVNSPDAVGG